MGIVRLSVAMGDKKRALLVLVHMKDLSLLTDKQKWGMLFTLSILSDFVFEISLCIFPQAIFLLPSKTGNCW